MLNNFVNFKLRMMPYNMDGNNTYHKISLYQIRCIDVIKQRQNVMSFKETGPTSSCFQMTETGILPVLR